MNEDDALRARVKTALKAAEAALERFLALDPDEGSDPEAKALLGDLRAFTVDCVGY